MADDSNFFKTIQGFKEQIMTRSGFGLEEEFFTLTQKYNYVPRPAPPMTHDSFLYILTEMAAIRPGSQRSLRSIDWLLHYLKHDKFLFEKYNPTEAELQKLDIGSYLGNPGEQIAIDYVCFLLRYRSNILVSSFSTDPKAVERLRREEMHHLWSDVENLAKAHVQFVKEFETHQNTVDVKLMKLDSGPAVEAPRLLSEDEFFIALKHDMNALSSNYRDLKTDLQTEMEKIKQDMLQQALTKSEAKSTAPSEFYENQMVNFQDTMKSLEQKVSGFQQVDVQPFKDSLQELLPRIGQIDSTLTAAAADRQHLQEQIVESGLRFKTLEDDFTDLQAKLDKTADILQEKVTDYLGNTQQDSPQTQNQIVSINVKINEISADLTNLQTRFDDMPSFLTHDKLQQYLNTWNEEVNKTITSYFEQRMTPFQNEIDNMKIVVSQSRPAHRTAAAENAQLQNFSEKIQILEEQLKRYFTSKPQDSNVVWGMFKNFVHTQARDKFRNVRSLDTTVEKKMDTINWLIKHIEFISSKVVLELLTQFRNMVEQAAEVKNPIVYARHSSTVIQDILEAIRSHKFRPMIDPNGVSKQSLLFAILEVLLLIDYNLSQSILLGVVELTLDELNFQTKLDFVHVYIMRWLANWSRSDAMGERLVNYNGVLALLKAIHEFPEVELVANALKTIKSVLAISKNLETLHSKTKGTLLEDILNLINKYATSDVILDEGCGAIYNYCRIAELINVPPQKFYKLVELALDPLQKRYSLYSKGSLQLLATQDLYRSYIDQLGGGDIIRGPPITL